MIFKPQLEKLGASRKPEDWILDQLFNPSLLVRNDFTMKDAIEFYYDRFEVLGASHISLLYSFNLNDEDTLFKYSISTIRLCIKLHFLSISISLEIS